MALAPDPKTNHLLGALPPADLQRWLSQLDPVELPLGHALYESGRTLSHVYFPTTAIISLLYVMENGASAEIAIVGNEGIVGISLFMGGESTPSRAVVQSAGQGLRLKAHLIKHEFERAGPAMHLLLRYTQALITQMAQTAVCNRHHSLDQQLCRWLLLSLDRLQGSELLMTHEALRKLAGVCNTTADGSADSASATVNVSSTDTATTASPSPRLGVGGKVMLSLIRWGTGQPDRPCPSSSALNFNPKIDWSVPHQRKLPRRTTLTIPRRIAAPTNETIKPGRLKLFWLMVPTPTSGEMNQPPSMAPTMPTTTFRNMPC
jgi:hypothetical protein